MINFLMTFMLVSLLTAVDIILIGVFAVIIVTLAIAGYKAIKGYLANNSD